MREIKFRAWHKERKEMVEVETIHLIGFDGPTGRSGNNWMQPYRAGDLWSCAAVELMQYTGLQDTHDQDIYEGDILKMGDATAKVVFWGRPPEFGLDFSHNEEAWCEDWNLSDDSDRMEIIGNVYEHPELIVRDSTEDTTNEHGTVLSGEPTTTHTMRRFLLVRNIVGGQTTIQGVEWGNGCLSIDPQQGATCDLWFYRSWEELHDYHPKDQVIWIDPVPELPSPKEQ